MAPEATAPVKMPFAKPRSALMPHLPTPPCPNCQCGCTVTGSCTCKDCDHPQLVPPKK